MVDRYQFAGAKMRRNLLDLLDRDNRIRAGAEMSVGIRIEARWAGLWIRFMVLKDSASQRNVGPPRMKSGQTS